MPSRELCGGQICVTPDAANFDHPVAGKRQQPPPVVGDPLVVDGVELLQPFTRHRMIEVSGIRGHTDLSAAKLPREVHDAGQVGARMHPPGVEQRLVGHQQAAGAVFGERNGSGEVGIDAFAVDRKLGELLLHRLLLVEACLADIEQGGANHHVRYLEISLHEGERGVAMQGRSDERGRFGVLVEQDVLPWDQDVVEYEQRIHLVEAVG